METHEVTKEESEIIETSTRKHLLCKHKKSGLLYEINPLNNIDWENHRKEYFDYLPELNLWIDKDIQEVENES